MKLELDEIFTVIDKVNEAELDSFAYKDADIKLSIKRKGGGEEEAVHASIPKKVNPAPQSAQTVDSGDELGETSGGAKAEKAGKAENATGITIDCPMVGTFYAAPAKDKEPFVTEGDTVKKGQVVGIVEAMKLMNEIESEYDGIVEKVLVENEQLVEYGQPLMRIREV